MPFDHPDSCFSTTFTPIKFKFSFGLNPNELVWCLLCHRAKIISNELLSRALLTLHLGDFYYRTSDLRRIVREYRSEKNSFEIQPRRRFFFPRYKLPLFLTYRSKYLLSHTLFTGTMPFALRSLKYHCHMRGAPVPSAGQWDVTGITVWAI